MDDYFDPRRGERGGLPAARIACSHCQCPDCQLERKDRVARARRRAFASWLAERTLVFLAGVFFGLLPAFLVLHHLGSMLDRCR